MLPPVTLDARDDGPLPPLGRGPRLRGVHGGAGGAGRAGEVRFGHHGARCGSGLVRLGLAVASRRRRRRRCRRVVVGVRGSSGGLIWGWPYARAPPGGLFGREGLAKHEPGGAGHGTRAGVGGRRTGMCAAACQACKAAPAQRIVEGSSASRRAAGAEVGVLAWARRVGRATARTGVLIKPGLAVSYGRPGAPGCRSKSA